MNIKPNALSLLTLLVGLSLILAGCQSPPQPDFTGEDFLQVTVSILPQAYFVERIGGEFVAVNIMVGPGEEAHTYEPKPEQMRALNDSLAFLSIGVEYEENWIPRFKDINPSLMVVNSAEGIQRIPLSEMHADVLNEQDEHSDKGLNLDPHVWLAPENGRVIAANILDTLSDLAPYHSATFQANYDSLMVDIDELDTRISSTLAGLENRQFMVFHPAWGYFAQQYHLEQIPIQVDGQDPSPRELADLVDAARSENIQVIFIQPNFSTADAQALAAEINAEIAWVDPLSSDWLTNLSLTADAFAAALDK